MQPVRPTRQNVSGRPPIIGKQTGLAAAMSSRIVSTGTPGFRPTTVRLPGAPVPTSVSTENIGMAGLGETPVARENGDFNADEMKAKLRAWHVRVKTNKAAMNIGGGAQDKGPCTEVTVTTRSVGGAVSVVGQRPPAVVSFGGKGPPSGAVGIPHLRAEASGRSLLSNPATALAGPSTVTSVVSEKANASVVSVPGSFVEPASQASQVQVVSRGRSVESFSSGPPSGPSQEAGLPVSAVSVGSANFSGPLSLSEILKRKKSTKVDVKRTSESLTKELITARPKTILAPRPISQPQAAQASAVSETTFVSTGDGSSGGPLHVAEELGAGPKVGPLSFSRGSTGVVPPPPPPGPAQEPPKLNNGAPLGPPRPPLFPPLRSSSSCPVSPRPDGSQFKHALGLTLPEVPAPTSVALVSEPPIVVRTPASFPPPPRPPPPADPSQGTPQKSALLAAVPPTISTPSLSSVARFPVPLPPSLAASSSVKPRPPPRKVSTPSKASLVGVQQKQQQVVTPKPASSGLVAASPRPVSKQAARALSAQQPSKRPQVSTLVTTEASTDSVVPSALTTPPLVLPPVPLPASVTQDDTKVAGPLETKECFAQSKPSPAPTTTGSQDARAADRASGPVGKFEGIGSVSISGALESTDNDAAQVSSAAGPIEAPPSQLPQCSPKVPPATMVEPIEPILRESRSASLPSLSEDEPMPRALESVTPVDHVQKPLVSCPSFKRVKCANSEPDKSPSTLTSVDMELSSLINTQPQGPVERSLQSQLGYSGGPTHNLIQDLLKHLSLQEASSSGQWLARLVQRATQLSQREAITGTLSSCAETSTSGRSVEELVQRCALAQKVLQLVSSSLTASPAAPHMSLKDRPVSLSSPLTTKGQDTSGSSTHHHDA